MGIRERIIEELTTKAEARGVAIGEARGVEIGEARGVEIGVEITKKQGIRKALQKGSLSIEDIADLFDVSVDYVRKMQQEGDTE